MTTDKKMQTEVRRLRVALEIEKTGREHKYVRRARLLRWIDKHGLQEAAEAKPGKRRRHLLKVLKCDSVPSPE